MIAIDGWLDGARRSPSPNCDERPAGSPIDLLVIHSISLPPEEFGGPWIEALFRNRLPADEHACFRDIADLRVSAHLLIRRDGELIQFVPFDKRAWHAGESSFEGRTRCNDFSIGIELEGGETAPFSDLQYEALSAVVEALCARYPGIGPERIVGHCDIAPGRKTDPGPRFDWPRLRGGLSAAMVNSRPPAPLQDRDD